MVRRSEHFPELEDPRQYQLDRKGLGDAGSAVGMVGEVATDGGLRRSRGLV